MPRVDVAIADRISDQIVAIVNKELDAMRIRGEISPLSLLAGQLLGLMATLRTAPPFLRPVVLEEVEVATRKCLTELLAMSNIKETSPP